MPADSNNRARGHPAAGREVRLETPTADFKLGSAKFFLDRLRECRRHPRSAEFGYYLSAFLNEGRSVTLALQNDAKERYDERFAEWRTGQTLETLSVLQFMNDQRVEEFHQKGTKVATQGKSTKLGFAVQLPDGRFVGIPSLFGEGTAAYGLVPEHYW